MPNTHIILSHDAENMLREINAIYTRNHEYGFQADNTFWELHQNDSCPDSRDAILQFLANNGLIQSQSIIIPTELGRNRKEYKFFHILYSYLIPASVSFLVSITTTLIVLKLKGSL